MHEDVNALCFLNLIFESFFMGGFVNKNENKGAWLVFASPIAKYKTLNNSDRAYVNTILLFSSLVVLLSIGLVSYFDKQGILSLASSFALSIVVAVSFNVFDRIGVQAPIEERLKDTFNALKRQSEDYKELLENRPDYSVIKVAKDSFGLVAIRGALDVSKRPAKVLRGTDEFALEVINRAQRGTTIRYMNTYLQDTFNYCREIEDAAKRGVNFKMLFMYPDVKNSPAFNARYQDCLRNVFYGKKIEDVMHQVRSMMHLLDALPNIVRSQRADNSLIGECEIRYYSESLNFPMLCVTYEKDGSENIPTVAYTGFYTSISSESMPYIEWRDGEFNIVSKFIELFDKKWEKCADRSWLYDHNKPGDD